MYLARLLFILLYHISPYSYTVTISLSDGTRPQGFLPRSSTDRINTCTFHRASDHYTFFVSCIKRVVCLLNLKLLQKNSDTATENFYSSYTPLFKVSTLSNVRCFQGLAAAPPALTLTWIILHRSVYYIADEKIYLRIIY